MLKKCPFQPAIGLVVYHHLSTDDYVIVDDGQFSGRIYYWFQNYYNSIMFFENQSDAVLFRIASQHSGFTTIKILENRMQVLGDISFNDATVENLAELNEIKILDICGSLSLSNSYITEFPKTPTFTGSLHLYNCRILEQLPENFCVAEDLDIRRCVALRCLPSNLQVGGILDMRGCLKIQYLPTNMTIGKYIDGFSGDRSQYPQYKFFEDMN